MLSTATFILNQDSITESEFNLAKERLEKFSFDFPRLYGIENEVFNSHLMSHLTDSVRDCGPFWGFSNFPFEDMNGVLKNNVNGTSDVLKQIVSKYVLNASIHKTLTTDKEPHRKNVEKVDNSVATLFGKSQLPTKKMKKEIRSIVLMTDIKDSRFYKSCSINSNLIKCFDIKGQCDDSVIKTKNDEYCRVYYIFKLREQIFLCVKILKTTQTSSTLYAEHLKSIIKEEKELHLLPITDLSEKCIFIATQKYSIISNFPNNVERY